MHDLPLLPHPPRLLEVHEVAYQLKCSQETVLRRIRTGQLVAIRFGTRSWRVAPHDLQAFIDALRVHANGNGNGNGNGHAPRDGDGA
jgi:excisionase family DNA binding protein